MVYDFREKVFSVRKKAAITLRGLLDENLQLVLGRNIASC